MILGAAFMVELLLSTAFGQGEVFLFGQMVSTSRQSLPEVARIKTQNENIHFDVSSRSKKSARMVLFNNDTRLNISSIMHNNSSRSVTASITAGNIPNGTTLKLAVLNPNDNFNGDPGTLSKEVILSDKPKSIVSEIETCYSGKNSDDGYGLEYTLIVPPTKAPDKSDNNSVTVTLTLASDV